MLKNLLTVSVKNKAQPFHYHDKLEIFFVLRGEMVLLCNDRNDHLACGNINLVNRDDVHCIDNVTDDLIYIQMTIDILNFDQYLPGISKVYFKGTIDEADTVAKNLKEEIKDYIAKIVFIMEDPYNYQNGEQTIVYYCIEILNNLKMRFNYIGKKLSESIDNRRFDQIWEVIDYVYDNCWRKLTIKEVAEHIFVSTSYLRALLKELSGKTFEDFLAFVRAENSLKYLINSDRSITNIAQECGFSAPRYYYTAFEKNYHCSPSEYRNKNKAFFRMEKSNSPAQIFYDSGIVKREYLKLLEEYSTFEDKGSSVQEITIDLSEHMAQKDIVTYGKNEVILKEEDIYRLHIAEELKACHDDLGIVYVKLLSVDKKIEAFIKNNLAILDLELDDNESSSKEKKSVKLNEIFNEFGDKKAEFYIYKMFNEIKGYCTIKGKNSVAYEREGIVNVLIYNTEKKKNINYALEITGLLSERTYLCKIQEYLQPKPNIVENLKNEKIRENISEKELVEILKPKVSYFFYKTGMPQFINGQINGIGIISVMIRML